MGNNQTNNSMKALATTLLILLALTSSKAQECSDYLLNEKPDVSDWVLVDTIQTGLTEEDLWLTGSRIVSDHKGKCPEPIVHEETKVNMKNGLVYQRMIYYSWRFKPSQWNGKTIIRTKKTEK